MSDLYGLLRDSLFNKPASETYLLLFISGSDPCGNCFNEISDYLALVNDVDSLTASYRSLLIYHGADEQQASRYIKTSGISEKIHHTAFATPSGITNFDYGSLIQRYGSQNLLYLVDMPQKIIFHGFILPAGNTTRWESKKIAFTDAIHNHTRK